MSGEKIGLIASDECRSQIHPSGKRWFHAAKFIRAYRQLFADYDIVTTDGTAGLLTTL